MSVTVRHLNADSTFLLIFSPKTNPSRDDLLASNGAFSVLIDPWVVGSSVINAKWFAISQRLVPSAVRHLSEIEEPDVVLVSQNKPDHCHKETLLQLKPEGKTLIAAEPAAAKSIRSWNHFHPNRVHALRKYHTRARFGNALRLTLPPLGPDGLPGELNIAFIPARNYITGMHNAFGITYQAPTYVKTLAPVTTIDLPGNDISLPFSPVSAQSFSPLSTLSSRLTSPNIPEQTSSYEPPARTVTPTLECEQERGHMPPLSRSSNTQASEFLSLQDQINVRQPTKELAQAKSTTAINYSTWTEIDCDAGTLRGTTAFVNTLPTPPLSPSSCASPWSKNSEVTSLSTPPTSTTTQTSFSYSLPHSPLLADLQSRYSAPPAIRPARPQAVSILYSPHGIPLSDLRQYVQNHLVTLPGALPLTCLLHSFDYASNPWWFGGNIMMGADSGIEIATALMARCWISAHDEVKDDKGVAVKLLKCDRNTADVVKERFRRVEVAWDCDVRSLDVGAEVKLTSEARRGRIREPASQPKGLGVEVAGFQFFDGG